MADQMTKRGIACAGNWIVDIVHTAPYWPNKGDLVRLAGCHIGVGGGAANVLTDLSSLGADFPLAALGRIGSDANGAVILDHIAKIGVKTNALVTVADNLTAYDQVINVAGDSRTFFYHGGANDTFCAQDVPMDDLAAQGYRIFYLGYLMLLEALDQLRVDGTTGAADLLAAARAAGMITCVDMVSDANPSFCDIVAPALAHCDYLIINEIEAGRATGLTLRSTSDELLHDQVVAAALALLAGGVQCGVVIHAPEGALWAGDDLLWVPAQPIAPHNIVSPVGAGDAFCAAVLYGIHENWPHEKTLKIAHLAAAACLGGATATDGIPTMATLLQHFTP